MTERIIMAISAIVCFVGGYRLYKIIKKAEMMEDDKR